MFSMSDDLKRGIIYKEIRSRMALFPSILLWADPGDR